MWIIWSSDLTKGLLIILHHEIWVSILRDGGIIRSNGENAYNRSTTWRKEYRQVGVGVRVLIRVRFGFIRVLGFRVKDFSLIQIFLNFGLGSVRIFADSVRARITHLKLFFKF